MFEFVVEGNRNLIYALEFFEDEVRVDSQFFLQEGEFGS